MGRREREVADWRRRAGIAPEFAKRDPVEPIEPSRGYKAPAPVDIDALRRESEAARVLMRGL